MLPISFKHSVDVATMSMIVGKKHGLNNKEVYELGISGLLHDVGKSKIPNEILNKAAKPKEPIVAAAKCINSCIFHPTPKVKFTSAKPSAMIIASKMDSINRISPVMVSPENISRREFVKAIPGINSMTLPILMRST